MKNILGFIAATIVYNYAIQYVLTWFGMLKPIIILTAIAIWALLANKFISKQISMTRKFDMLRGRTYIQAVNY
jgi:hypothetical protein